MTVPEHTVEPSPLTDHPPPPTPARRSWRPFVVRLHFYAGVLGAPFLVVAAVTGGLYALAPTLERFVYGDLLYVEPSGPPLPLDVQAATARAAFPHLAVTGLRPPASDRDSTRIYFSDPSLGEEFSRAVFVDPYPGAVLGDETT
ncbi:PepSY-associated TM helix domain-containing protein, partial [Mycolicibacterium hippocampi]|uniref:PepSY-associated TM helix domain-containing protein n=1 Tax=Mycolicibacterium hippocampi TaxID=659824 RepID=UPI0035117BBF